MADRHRFERELAALGLRERQVAADFMGLPTKAERALSSIGKWGRNASPFSIAKTQVMLHWKGVSYWLKVRKAAKAGRALLKYVEGLERGARALKTAADELARFESELPQYPLKMPADAPRAGVSQAELKDVEKYYNTAAAIADDAEALKKEIRKAIEGWDGVVKQADNTKDFTRRAVWDAITDLNLRFNNEGGEFRAYLVNARDLADDVEYWARHKQYHAADILSKWTPPGYQPPSPP